MYLQPAHDHGEPHGTADTEAFHRGGFPQGLDAQNRRGVIGGKACGLLVARKLIELNMPEYAGHVEPHNSFFIGTDVFYRYLVYNRCAELKARHRLEKEHFKETEELTKRLRAVPCPKIYVKS